MEEKSDLLKRFTVKTHSKEVSDPPKKKRQTGEKKLVIEQQYLKNNFIQKRTKKQKVCAIEKMAQDSPFARSKKVCIHINKTKIIHVNFFFFFM